ncbi:MAG: NOP5/NOP56 family protein [Nitrososphaeraceae archaeon]
MSDGKCSVILCELGLILLDENESVLGSIKFSNPMESYRLIKNGGRFTGLGQFTGKFANYSDVRSNDQSLNFVLQQNGITSTMMNDDELKILLLQKDSLLKKAEFVSNTTQAQRELRKFAIDLSSSKIKESSEQLDLHVIQAVSALDELDKIINTIGTRMREWYGLHFPELDNLIQSISLYANIVREAGFRASITNELLERLGLDEKRRQIVLQAAERSRGGDITSENLAIIKQLAYQVILQTELRRIIADHIEDTMELIAPNTKELLSPLVGARMIAKAGSLERFAHLSSSTVQVLGAEKALFRSLKTGSSTPKHGILFQHPLIHSAPRWQRGKIARSVASKASIAARIDLYRTGEKDLFLADKLKLRINEIQQKYSQPPPERPNRTFRNRPFDRFSPGPRGRGGRGRYSDDRGRGRYSDDRGRGYGEGMKYRSNKKKKRRPS